MSSVSCGEEKDPTFVQESLDKSDEDPDDCEDFQKAKDIQYRTHLYFVDFEYDSNDAENDVTFVSQLSIDRLHLIENLCQQWKGNWN